MTDTSHYSVQVAWSEPENLFVATAPDLRGCVARGATRAAALAALAIAIEVWIDEAKILGLALPTPTPPTGSAATSPVARSEHHPKKWVAVLGQEDATEARAQATRSDDARRKTASLGEGTAELSAADVALRAYQLAKAA